MLLRAQKHHDLLSLLLLFLTSLLVGRVGRAVVNGMVAGPEVSVWRRHGQFMSEIGEDSVRSLRKAILRHAFFRLIVGLLKL